MLNQFIVEISKILVETDLFLLKTKTKEIKFGILYEGNKSNTFIIASSETFDECSVYCIRVYSRQYSLLKQTELYSLDDIGAFFDAINEDLKESSLNDLVREKISNINNWFKKKLEKVN